MDTEQLVRNELLRLSVYPTFYTDNYGNQRFADTDFEFDVRNNSVYKLAYTNYYGYYNAEILLECLQGIEFTSMDEYSDDYFFLQIQSAEIEDWYY